MSARPWAALPPPLPPDISRLLCVGYDPRRRLHPRNAALMRNQQVAELYALERVVKYAAYVGQWMIVAGCHIGLSLRTQIFFFLVRGHLKRGVHAMQLFGRLTVVQTHTLWY